MSSYGFNKVKKAVPPAHAPEETLPRRTLDLAGLSNTPVVEPTPLQEQAAIAAGERLGFVGREAPATAPPAARAARSRQQVASKAILLKGPQTVVDRFVNYANERQVRAYWELLDEYLKSKGR